MHCWLRLKKHKWSDWMYGLFGKYWVKYCSECKNTKYKDRKDTD